MSNNLVRYLISWNAAFIKFRRFSSQYIIKPLHITKTSHQIIIEKGLEKMCFAYVLLILIKFTFYIMVVFKEVIYATNSGVIQRRCVIHSSVAFQTNINTSL